MFTICPTDIARIESDEDQLQINSFWQRFAAVQGFPYQVEAIEFLGDLIIRFKDHRDEIVFSFAIQYQ